MFLYVGRMSNSGLSLPKCHCHFFQMAVGKRHIVRMNSPNQLENDEPKKIVVVGGGWAGFAAAHELAKAGCRVTLLDAAPNPGGLSTGFRTLQGKPVEAGVKGFWWQYHNIFRLIKELSIPWPFTRWTRSSFYSPEGITVESPIFSDLPRLPTPLGSFIYTLPYFRNLSIVDRLSAFSLIVALIEFDTDEESYRKYDAMTARELFREAHISKNLFQKFLEPILLVTLFAPPEKLSGAATLGALYYYVLAHQQDFDVCWCKGSIVERIFEPWIQAMKNLGAQILPSRRVKDVIVDKEGSKVISVIAVNSTGEAEVHDVDAVIFAVGVHAMQKIVASSDQLAARHEFSSVTNIGTIDVLAIRLWFDRLIRLPNPSNVLAGFEDGSGGTLFHLNDLQEEFSRESGSVFELDIFHASHLLVLKDDFVIKKILSTYLARSDERFAEARIVDYSVLRFKNAVTMFGPNSHQFMPSICTSFQNVFLAGDWLRQGPGSHGARGLSQEKAYVTGLQAANAAAKSLHIKYRAEILEVEPHEWHIAASKVFARKLKTAFHNLGFLSPLL